MKVSDLIYELKKFSPISEVIIGTDRLPVGGVDSFQLNWRSPVQCWIIPDIESTFDEHDEMMFYSIDEEKIVSK